MRFLAAAFLLSVSAPLPAQTHLLVVSGIGGEPRYASAYAERARSLVQSALTRFGMDSAHARWLGENTAPPSSREHVVAAIRALAARAEPNATVVFVLIGHGSTRGAEGLLNLRGPDLTSTEFAALLAAFPSQQVVVVNTTSASGAWLAPLAAPGRILISATRSGTERDEPEFGRYFAQALAGDIADADRNGRVSLLEAFDYARREVDRQYRSAGRLRTEHALLDDDGDGTGSLEPSATGTDGRLAAGIYLGPPAAAERDPLIAALVVRQDSLERAVVRLRGLRAAMDSTAYARELERLLLDVARVGREIRQRRGPQP